MSTKSDYRVKLVCFFLVCFVGACSSIEAKSEKINDVLFGVTLGESSLNSVQDILGKSRLIKQGDAAYSETFVCYTFSKNRVNQVVVFASDEELAGSPEYTITRVDLYASTQYPYSKDDCLDIGVSEKLADSFIGYTKEGFSVHFGLPETVINDHYEKTVCHKELITPDSKNYKYWRGKKDCFQINEDPYVDVCATLKAVFKDGMLVKFSLSKVTSVC